MAVPCPVDTPNDLHRTAKHGPARLNAKLSLRATGKRWCGPAAGRVIGLAPLRPLGVAARPTKRQCARTEHPRGFTALKPR